MSASGNDLSRLISALVGSNSGGGVNASALLRVVTGASSTGDAGAASTVARIGSSVLGTGSLPGDESGWTRVLSTVASPIGAIASFLGGLFGGDETPTVLKPERYQPAAAVQYDFGVSDQVNGYASVDSSQSGLSRLTSNGGGASTGGDIVIQVQAMDSRSFLDHSNEIAEAVRRALLDSHPLRDVIKE